MENKLRLLKITKSPDPEKKLRATFEKNGREINRDFGQSGAPDYTITHDEEQRERYRTRHQKDLKTQDPTRPGYLSMHILWGDSTSVRKNIADYKKKFGL